MEFSGIKISRAYLTRAGIAVIDAMLVIVALYCAYMIRFDFSIWDVYGTQLLYLLPVFVLIRLTALYYMKSYRFIWKYASVNDLMRVLKAISGGMVLLVVVNYFRNYPFAMLLSLAFFLSALFHRGVLHFLPRMRHKRLLIAIFGLGTIPLLLASLFAYTILTSAPLTFYEIPFIGTYVETMAFPHDLAMPRGVLIMESILSFVLVSCFRMGPRLFSELFLRKGKRGKRTLILGAGDVGESIVRTLKQRPELGFWPVAFVDDDIDKQRVSIHGVSVLGMRQDLGRLIEQHRIEELLITASSLLGQDLREIAAVCLQKQVSVRRVPSLFRMVDAEGGLQRFESIDIKELLGRPEIELDPGRVQQYLQNRVVLVTGAGGSIGSELCRQINHCQPAQLVLLGKGENSIYQIEKELEGNFPNIEMVSVIGDICNPVKMNFIFETFKPDIIFHAAAYKHVPFMEDSPEESVINNILGTQTVALAALRHQVSKFVLISSDKAVHPTSMMGATKKIAELILQQLAQRGDTQFITVRFGNVLRSRGSVIPLFEKQIKAGGPVTVTHPDMIRFFMSIPEAVRLVLHSGVMGGSGDLCILDMGEQVRIVDLARNMIRNAGKIPDENIEIVFTGIRPGEKLYEELFTEHEARSLHKIDKIFVCKPEGCDWEKFDDTLECLHRAAKECKRDEIIRLLGKLIPSYQPFIEKGIPEVAPQDSVE
jgi:FlaA1/EpsC-like NDP-sugar epimerase